MASAFCKINYYSVVESGGEATTGLRLGGFTGFTGLLASESEQKQARLGFRLRSVVGGRTLHLSVPCIPGIPRVACVACSTVFVEEWRNGDSSPSAHQRRGGSDQQGLRIGLGSARPRVGPTRLATLGEGVSGVAPSNTASPPAKPSTTQHRGEELQKTRPSCWSHHRCIIRCLAPGN